MLGLAYKYRYLLLLAVIWLAFECWISSQAFCDQSQHKAGSDQAYKEYPCQLRGPLLFIAQSFARWWQHSFDKPDAYVALFTAVLAGCTLALWYVTYGLQQTTKDLVAAGDKQLKLARDEFVATHRPEIKVHAVETKQFPGKDKITRIGASILCFNKGRNAAVTVEVRGIITYAGTIPVDLQRPIIKTFSDVVSGQKLRFDISSFYSEKEILQFVGHGKGTMPRLYCVGTIVYFDEAKNRRETGFCFRFATTNERWMSAESPEHEYEY